MDDIDKRLLESSTKVAKKSNALSQAVEALNKLTAFSCPKQEKKEEKKEEKDA